METDQVALLLAVEAIHTVDMRRAEKAEADRAAWAEAHAMIAASQAGTGG